MKIIITAESITIDTDDALHDWEVIVALIAEFRGEDTSHE